MVTMAFRSSFGPESSVSISSLSTSVRNSSISRRRSVETSSPSCASSKYASISVDRRERSASVASEVSRRFFSRMTCWDLSGLDQSDGSAVCFSTSLSFSRSLGASKILLKVVDSFAKRGVFLFQFFDHGIHRSHKTIHHRGHTETEIKSSPRSGTTVVNRICTVGRGAPCRFNDKCEHLPPKPAQAAAFPQVRENATERQSM